MQFSSIWLIDRTLSGATTQGQSGPGRDGNKSVLHIPQISSITEASPSDCLVSYPGHSLGESYPSSKMYSVFSTAPANWAIIIAVNVSLGTPYASSICSIFSLCMESNASNDLSLYGKGRQNQEQNRSVLLLVIYLSLDYYLL